MNIHVNLETEEQPNRGGGHYCAPCSQVFKNNKTHYVFEIDFASADNFKKFDDLIKIRYKYYDPKTYKGGFRLCQRHGLKLIETIGLESDIPFEIDFEKLLEILCAL